MSVFSERVRAKLALRKRALTSKLRENRDVSPMGMINRSDPDAFETLREKLNQIIKEFTLMRRNEVTPAIKDYLHPEEPTGESTFIPITNDVVVPDRVIIDRTQRGMNSTAPVMNLNKNSQTINFAKTMAKKMKRRMPNENLFKKSKAKLAKGATELEPSHEQMEASTTNGKLFKKRKSKKAAFPIKKEITVKKNTKKIKSKKAMQQFGRTHDAAVMEFKGATTYGAGAVSGKIQGAKANGARQLTKATARAMGRSLGNQPDKSIADSPLESKGRRWAKRRTKGKVDKNTRKVESKTNTRTTNPSKKVKSRRVMTNSSQEVKSRFKNSKRNK